MAESEDGQEKTEDPSEKKLREAREKGQVARSKELTTFLMVISAALFLYFWGPQMIASFEMIMVQGLSLDRDHAYDFNKMLDKMLGLVVASIMMLMPFFLLMVFVAIVGSSLLGGFNFSSQAMAPKFSKLNPLKGLKRMVSMQALMELLKALGKFGLVLAVAIAFLWYAFGEVVSIGSQSLHVALAHAAKIIVEAFILVSLALIVIAMIDVPFQIYQHMNQLKMTKQEVKEEYKQQEGNPEVKARIRQIQREMSQRRMMQRVPEADVVITNPTHYSVALKYAPDTMDAPIVLALGVDFMAAQIRTSALENNIPIVEAPQLARALYYNSEPEQPIPHALFKAVAAVLAYVFGLKDNKKQKLDVSRLEIPSNLKTEP
ncbi:flagellar biosynthesis protein FlhB [Thiomicrospira microaerophila]|uniref:flagellar biosynthesis protein FlhB n=1 Tax=Thiomicrospira microaerophila TaxID=406020 RepID=UPI00200CB6A7|nr:flagellar biosynthesis protein FlhB [Thiomicrospira microaerophila]UQB41675.1 flagellar biosynthesis protein FlhB [Thiomicrospira microaerophila]